MVTKEIFKNKIPIWLVFKLIGLFPCLLSGQNYYLNNVNYGLKSVLLGGSTTAGVDDLSMVFYNPAAIKYAKGRFDFSLVMPKLSYYSFDHAFDEASKKASLKFNLLPNIVTYKFDASDKIKIVFALLQRDKINYDITFDNNFINEDFNQKIAFKYQLEASDDWFGVGFSHEITEDFSWGLSFFTTNKSIKYSYLINSTLSPVDATQDTESVIQRHNIQVSSSFWNILKFGLSYSYGRSKIGGTITTPRFWPVHRGGNFEIQDNRVDASFTRITEVFDFSPNIEMRTPWQFALGYAYSYDNNNRLYGQLNYQFGLGEYTMAVVQDNMANDIRLISFMKPILNLGLGYVAEISPKTQVIFGARTNFLAYENRRSEGDKLYINVLDTHRFHLTGGLNLKFNKNSITLGLDWGYSSDSAESILKNLENPTNLNLNPANISNNNWIVVLTYGFLIDTINTIVN